MNLPRVLVFQEQLYNQSGCLRNAFRNDVGSSDSGTRLLKIAGNVELTDPDPHYDNSGTHSATAPDIGSGS